MYQDINKAIQILKEGGIVIFPTDTAFGIGCRIDDVTAVRRLFKLRKRPESQATPVLGADLHMLIPFLQAVPLDVSEQLLKPYWPGALTVILKCKSDKVPELVRNNDTLGVRVPNHSKTLDIIRGVGVPILGPSANFHGEKTPFSLKELDPNLINLVDFIVPGICSLKQASTVIDTTIKPWKIIRQGAVIIKD